MASPRADTAAFLLSLLGLAALLAWLAQSGRHVSGADAGADGVARVPIAQRPS